MDPVINRYTLTYLNKKVPACQSPLNVPCREHSALSGLCTMPVVRFSSLAQQPDFFGINTGSRQTERYC